MKTNLAKSAMLVSVTVVNGGLLGERKDATASTLVHNTYNVSDRRAKASKYLIDRTHKSVKQVVAASQRIREVVYRYTMPWGDEKMRLLPTKTVDEFNRKLKIALAERDEAIEEYLHKYPSLISASQRDLGKLFDPHQYPTPDQVKSLFKHTVTFWPMPESNHFIAEISDKAAKEAKDGIEQEIENRLLDASNDLVRRAKTVVSELIAKLKGVKTGVDGNLEGVIRDSLIDNISETADLVERMNLTENREIKKVIKDLRRLTKFSPRQWRRSYHTFAHEKYGKSAALEIANEIMANLTRLELKDQEIDAMIDDTSDYMDA